MEFVQEWLNVLMIRNHKMTAASAEAYHDGKIEVAIQLAEWADYQRNRAEVLIKTFEVALEEHMFLIETLDLIPQMPEF